MTGKIRVFIPMALALFKDIAVLGSWTRWEGEHDGPVPTPPVTMGSR
jgi:hypothetical protein